MKRVSALIVAISVASSALATEQPARNGFDDHFEKVMAQIVERTCLHALRGVAADLVNAGVQVRLSSGLLTFESKTAQGQMTCLPTGLSYAVQRISNDGQPVGPMLTNF